MSVENILFDYILKHILLTEEEKQIITNLSLIKEYKKGTILLKEGRQSNDSYFILKGCLRSYYIIDCKEKTTEFYTELEGVVPVCVIQNKPSEYYISCLEDTILLVSNQQLEEEAFAKFPRFEMLCRILSEKLAAKKQIEFDNYKILNAEERYLKLLGSRPDLCQRVPQYQLASYLGITPQSLSRLRKRIISK